MRNHTPSPANLRKHSATKAARHAQLWPHRKCGCAYCAHFRKTQ